MNKPQTRTFSELFHSHKIHLLVLLCLVTDQKRLSKKSFVINFNQWNPYPFIQSCIPEASKRCPFRVEPPIIGHYREYHLPSPVNLPFLLLSLQLSPNNSIGNVCYVDYGFFKKPTTVHTQILGTQNKDFVSSLHTDLTRGLVSSVAQATVQLLSRVTSKNPLKACTSS